MHLLRTLLITATLLALLPAGAQDNGTGARSAKGTPTAFRTIGWDDLLPRDWDPWAGFKATDLRALADTDPRAVEMFRRVRAVWDEAPLQASMDGVAIRIPGYVVPLEETAQGVRELLLVPHFGACIHTPPPPANQIVHVRLKTPAKTLSSMDTVWISGTLKLARATTVHGVSGYVMDAVKVEPYSAPPR
jgi:hypothetical protein